MPLLSSFSVLLLLGLDALGDDDEDDGVVRSVIELGDGATTPCLYKAPIAFLKTALLTPGNSLLISSGDDLSPMGKVPPGADCNRDTICELNPSALALPPKARRPISNFPSSSLHGWFVVLG